MVQLIYGKICLCHVSGKDLSTTIAARKNTHTHKKEKDYFDVYDNFLLSLAFSFALSVAFLARSLGQVLYAHIELDYG